jgi:hypothetical protein
VQEDEADDDPGGQAQVKPGESLVEVSAHGQLLGKKAKEPKKQYFFQVYHETANSSALMEQETEEFEEELDGGVEALLEGSSDCLEHSTKPYKRDFHTLGEASISNLMAFQPAMVDTDEDIESLSCARSQNEEYRFLTKWRLRSGAKGDEANAKEIRIDYKCCHYGAKDQKLEECVWWCAPGGPVEFDLFGPADPRSNKCQMDGPENTPGYYPAVSSHGSILVLMQPTMAVACPMTPDGEGIRALVSWFFENTTKTQTGAYVRIRYYCCAQPVDTDMKFSGETMEVATDAQYKDDKVGALTAHNIECPVGTAMSGWSMREKDGSKFHMVATCQKIDGMPDIGAKSTCTWNGDPHFRCFENECNHDPMSPTTGFYWIVKNDIVQVQAYYQGADSSQPMRTKGVAFGGRFLAGCKAIVNHKTRKLDDLHAPKVYEGSSSVQVCYCNGECTADDCHEGTVDGVVKNCGTLENEDGVEEPVAETILNLHGGSSGINLPLGITYSGTHHSYWMDNTLTMSKMPGEFDGQCGNMDGNPGNDAPSATDEFRIGDGCDCGVGCTPADACYEGKLKDECLFYGHYTGHNGIGGGNGQGKPASLEECPPATLAEANAVCNMLFPPKMDPAEAATRKVFHHMCLLDECNTKGEQEKADIANGDKMAAELNQLSIDDAKPRIYKPTPKPDDDSKVLCKTLYGADSMLAKPTTEVENQVILESADDWANREVESERVTSTGCLKIGIHKSGPAGEEKWYWMPDVIPTSSTRCGPNWFRQGDIGEPGFMKDCLDTSEYGIEVSAAFDHLWSGHGTHSSQKDKVTNPNYDSVCVFKDSDDVARWKAYKHTDRESHACTQEKRFGIIAGSNAVMARSYCGLNKQLALMKSKHEISIAIATKLNGLEPTDAHQTMYIGGAYVEGGWMWDDGTPIENNPSDWVGGVVPSGGDNVFVCFRIPSCHLEACSGIDAANGHEPITRSIICENTHVEKPCPLSMYPQSLLKYGPGGGTDGGLSNAGAMWPLPLRGSKYQGRCFYIGAHQDSCEMVCKTSIKSIFHDGSTRMGTCDPAGLLKVRTKMACEMVAAGFKLAPTGEFGASIGAVGQYQQNGCMFEQKNKDTKIMVQLSTDDEGHIVQDPTCESTSQEGQHRVCACTLEHQDFTGALGVQQMIEISGLNSPATTLLERMEAKKKEKEAKKDAEKKKAMLQKEALLQRAGGKDVKADNLEGALTKKWFVLPTTTTKWTPIEDTTPEPPPDPLTQTIKVELVDASGLAGANTEREENHLLEAEELKSGQKLGAFTSITFEADPSEQTVERCYHKLNELGDDGGSECAKSTIWPFDSSVGASENAWSIDLRETVVTYEVFINGMRFPILDFPRLPSDFPTGVQLSGAYGGHVSRLPQVETAAARYNYLPENGCVKYEHKIEGPVATWYFTMVSDNLGGTQAVHGIPGTFIENSNIYFFEGGLRIVISDNGPREITFEYQFQTHRVYGIAIHYLKAERVVELYINTKRVEYQFFTHSAEVKFPEGLLGCTEYETSENKFLGKIWEFYVDLKSPIFRPPKDSCTEQECVGPKYKQIDDYATSFCEGSICNTTIDVESCCEEMPLCKNAETPFKCEIGSDYAGWADTTHCEDRLCEEGQSELCCAPKDICSVVNCGQWHVLVPDHAMIPCTSGLTCVQDNETSVDFIRCCEPVQNCSTHTCKSGYTQKPHALSTPCAGRQCGDADDPTCCAPEGMCTILRCPGEMQHIPEAYKTPCADTSCTDSSYGKCCMQEGRCDSIECPSPQILIAAATSTYCAGLACDRTEGSTDMQLCCEDPAPCSWYAEEWCGQDHVHKVFHLGNTSANCPGRVCREGEDLLSCCEEKAHCDNKTCPLTMRYLPNYLSILCDSTDCHTTPDFKCCSEDSSCSTFNCSKLGNYILKLNHSIEHCDDIVCRDSDLETCCDEAPMCDTRICPASMVPHPEAHLRYCQDRECSLNDKHRCCQKRMTCDRFDCAAHEMLYRHDAAFTLCEGADCLTTNPELCCVVKGSCLAVKCPSEEGLIHKSNASTTICEGGDCGADAKHKCCDEKEHCSSWNCPRRYNPKSNAAQLPCRDRYCSHADLHTCCQMEGWCINRTCPIGWQHRPDAYDTLCDDMACSEAITPEEKCCAEKGRCNSYECPRKYLPKLNASTIDCSDFECGDDDLLTCCDNATECSHHECGAGMTLRGDHADHFCSNRECGGVDHEICCVSLGSCGSLPCPEGMEHIADPTLLCTDAFCNETDPTVCCEHKGMCSTYACPEGYVHKDPPDSENCLGGECTDHDRDRCCEPTGYCNDATFACPIGMTPKVNHHNLFCPESECTTHDRLICCTFSNRCDSMQCPPGFLHRHDAYEIQCKGDNCNKDEDHELCCVKEGNCYSWKCPEEYVHRHNATKIFCEDWKCHEGADLDTCCLPRAPCNELQCKVESHDKLVNRWDAIDHLCVNQSCEFKDPLDDEQCCSEAHMCSTFECSDGLSHRHNANNISCSDKNCTDTDEDLCCAAKDMCHTYLCPKAYIHWHDADTRSCDGFICDDKDRDLCCQHVQWCNAMICPFGWANKVDAAGRLCATEKCNEEQDLDHCCETTHTCAQKTCDEGWTLRMDAHNKPCTDVQCLDTDMAYCCEEKPHCYSDRACPKNYVQKEPIAGRTLRCESNHRNSAGDLVCTAGDMTDICCIHIEHCDQYEPPLGFYLKPDGWNRSCASWKCTDVDLHTCAGEAGMCGNFSCTKGYVHRHDAHHIMCQDMDCDATSEDVCCVPEGHCHSVTCDVDYIHRAINMDTPACLGEQCDPVVDHDRCCHHAPKCTDFLCGGGHWSRRSQAENISCIHHPETQSCNEQDRETCCVENGMCTTYPCGDAMLHRHDAHEIMCHDADCSMTNESSCCAMMGFCPTYKCPDHMVHKNNSESTQCRDSLCTDADKYYCCDVRATCENFRCPAGKVWKDPTNMASLLCAGPACENPRDDEHCCKMEEACSTAADCSYNTCEDGKNNFVSQCASGDPRTDGLRNGNSGPTAIEGECFQKKADDFSCMNQPCDYKPPGASPGEWCCNGDLFRSCEAKTVVLGISHSDVTGGVNQATLQTQYETTSTTANGVTTSVEGGARLSYIGCGLLTNVKLATLFVGGLLALLPIATHVM